MTQSDMVVLARQIAVEYSLPPDLVCAVCEHESSWQPYAWRYEPAFYERYVAPIPGLTPTEAHGRAYSFGLMQIMGQTARELGYVGEDISGLFDPETALEYGCKKLAQCMERAGGDQSVALLYYNGGDDTTYPAFVLGLVPKYSVGKVG